MTDTIGGIRFEIAKLELRKGDRLIVKCDQVLSRDQETYIAELFAQLVPEGTGIIVLGAGMTLEVLQAK